MGAREVKWLDFTDVRIEIQPPQRSWRATGPGAKEKTTTTKKKKKKKKKKTTTKKRKRR